MDEHSGILRSGLGILMRNKRYVVWFYLLNLALAFMGSLALQRGLSLVLDKSLYADTLVHGFDVFTYLELSSRPELAGHAVARPHLYFTFVFLFLSVLFMPGVLDAYASTRRLSRDDFWATCGRNLWRFVRLFVIFGLITSAVFGGLTAINVALGKAASKSRNEMLPFYVQLIGGVLIFLIMTWIRIWYDLAQVDVVLRDQGRVRTAMRSAAEYASRSMGRLLGIYVLISLIAVVVLIAGMWLWDVIVPPANVIGAFFMGQLILFIFLAARFWQRGCAVAVSTARMNAIAAEEQLIAAVAPATPTTETGPAI